MDLNIFVNSSINILLACIVGFWTVFLLIKIIHRTLVGDYASLSSRDIDKSVDYLKDNKISSGKITLTKKHIEFSSDETNVIRTSRRNSNRFRQVGEKRSTYSDDDVLPFVTGVAVGSLISDTNSNNDSCSNYDSPSSCDVGGGD
ncbi:hypothetical protein CN586_11795 [Bacillus toyonensis]|uniref:hypothetical protein n=1 Tax=Bacillus toyonensis TaxID=155322 RepID=UPI000BF0203B|nr:hypothetical protein [Bacillus toyonensis]PEK48157.1 hypothetical protein CN586_11795 [Bacillus toyonensis]PEO71015.1 hypothetical protein CN579_00920 [Bacillus toyonensis]